MAAKKILSTSSAAEFAALIARIPRDVFTSMIRRANSALTKEEARALLRAFDELTG